MSKDFFADSNFQLMVSFSDDLSGVVVSYQHYKNFAEFCRSLVDVFNKPELPFVQYSDSYSVRILFAFDSVSVNEVFSNPVTFSELHKLIKSLKNPSTAVHRVYEFFNSIME